MSTFIEEPAVSVAEVAKRAGLTVDEVEAEASALGMFVGLTWDHAPALSTRDAFALVDGSARRNREHEAAWHTYQRDLAEWQAARENLRRETFQATWAAGVGRGLNNGPATDQAHAAGREAVAKFDKTNPEPVFSEPKSRVQSWLRKVGVR